MTVVSPMAGGIAPLIRWYKPSSPRAATRLVVLASTSGTMYAPVLVKVIAEPLLSSSAPTDRTDAVA